MLTILSAFIVLAAAPDIDPEPPQILERCVAQRLGEGAQD